MSFPAYWNTYFDLVGIKPKQSESLFEQIQDQGYLSFHPKAILELDDQLIAGLYYKLLESNSGVIESPVKNRSDSSWMLESDFCFLNIRACNPEPDKPGTFSNALKLILSLPANAIHLAPFYECVFGNIYAINSLRHINPECIALDWQSRGLSGDSQLKLFVDAAHLLNKTLGFDLEPHTAQFSRIVLDNPEYFRWLVIDGSRTKLQGGLEQEKMLEPKFQEKIIGEVKAIVKKHYQKHGIRFLEDPNLDTINSRAVQETITAELIKKGFWTIPCHTWNGVGLPEFVKYNFNENYPIFDYRDVNGNDQAVHAFGMLTPYKTAHGLRINQSSTMANPSRPWQEGVEWLANIYPNLIKEFDFDFIRFDYVDHIFDSIVEEDHNLPVSDRLTPAALKAIIQKSRSIAPQTGVLAERMGYDLERYSSLGFDIILGADSLRPLDMAFLQDMLEVQTNIENHNNQHPNQRCSVMTAIDTHDTGHPQIGVPPALFGRESMLLRLKLSLFGNAGLGHRPLYEVIGNQDMTTGLYEANNQPISLSWTADLDFYQSQKAIRDQFVEFKSILKVSKIREHYIGSDWGFWCIDRMDGIRLRIVCVCRPDTVPEDLEKQNISLYPFNHYWFDEARIVELDLISGKTKYQPIEIDGTINIGKVSKSELRVFFITEYNSQLRGQ